MGDDRVERLDLLRGQTQAVLLAAHIDRDDERLTRIEQGSRLAQYLREQGNLEGAARIGHLGKGETVAAPGGALLAADHDAGELEPVCRVRREASRQLGVTNDPGALEAFAVRVERMARQVKADRRKFVLQPLDGRPVGDQRQGRAGGEVRVDPVKEAYLAALALLGGKARLPQELLGGRKGLRAVRVEAVERAGLGEALELA